MTDTRPMAEYFPQSCFP